MTARRIAVVTAGLSNPSSPNTSPVVLARALERRAPAAARDPFDPATHLGEGRSFGHLLGGPAGSDRDFAEIR